MTPFAPYQLDKEFSFLNRTESMNKTIEENSSVEFEKEMKKIEEERKNEYENIDTSKISIEKSYGGWNSELESEDSHFQDTSEIKNAISILLKANLLKLDSAMTFYKGHFLNLIKNK